MPSRTLASTAWPVALLCSMGCTNQLIIPPSRLAVGTGVSTSNAREGESARRDPSGAFDLHWTVHPLALAPSVHHRRVDVGMGYGATWAGDDTHGPELLAEYFFWHDPHWRAGLVGSAQIAMAEVAQRRERGYGAALGIDVERAGFVDSTRHAHGEWGLGSYWTVRRVSVDELVVYSFVFGFEARVPLAGTN